MKLVNEKLIGDQEATDTLRSEPIAEDVGEPIDDSDWYEDSWPEIKQINAQARATRDSQRAASANSGLSQNTTKKQVVYIVYLRNRDFLDDEDTKFIKVLACVNDFPTVVKSFEKSINDLAMDDDYNQKLDIHLAKIALGQDEIKKIEDWIVEPTSPTDLDWLDWFDSRVHLECSSFSNTRSNKMIAHENLYELMHEAITLELKDVRGLVFGDSDADLGAESEAFNRLWDELAADPVARQKIIKQYLKTEYFWFV